MFSKLPVLKVPSNSRRTLSVYYIQGEGKVNKNVRNDPATKELRILQKFKIYKGRIDIYSSTIICNKMTEILVDLLTSNWIWGLRY